MATENTMDLIFTFIFIIAIAYLVVKRPHKKELTPFVCQKQAEEIAKGIEALINELVQESEYGKQTNKEIEQLKSEVKQLRKELSELKGDDYEKQIRKE